MRLPLAWARGLPDSAIAHGVFEDQTDGVAVLGIGGIVLHANARFTALTGVQSGALAWAALPQSDAAVLGAALQASRAAARIATVGLPEASRTLQMSLLPIAGNRGLLRVNDQTRELADDERHGQAQRWQAVGELAGGIAHDFNNLLTVILGAAEDLTGRATAEADRAELGQIRQSATRGADLVRQLLAFSRQQTLLPRVVRLNEAVRDTCQLLERLLGTDIKLELALEEPGRNVLIDPTQLAQVLMNLAVNARNAMPGGGTLTISSGHRLALRTEQFGAEPLPPGRYAVLSVADTGLGIPPDVLPRIFEPFFTTRRETGGTGLGLSTVHGIIRQSGGFMAVDSAPGRGTRFDILLPRHEALEVWQAEPAPPVIPPMAPPAAVPPSRIILLVDDEAPVRRLAERVLTRAGWQIVEAPTAEDAIDLVEGGLGGALGCVVSDVEMPGMNGPALVRHLRGTWPSLPAILMSGYTDLPNRKELASENVVFLSKPFTMAELTKTVARTLPALHSVTAGG